MYVIIWGYQVKAGCIPEFEKIYYSNGTWAELFRKRNGYICTELLHDETNPNRYMSIDRWDSAESYEAFHSQFKKNMKCSTCNAKDLLSMKF